MICRGGIAGLATELMYGFIGGGGGASGGKLNCISGSADAAPECGGFSGPPNGGGGGGAVEGDTAGAQAAGTD